MTLRPTPQARQWFLKAAATLLAVPAGFASATAGQVLQAQMPLVYPRAGVSSEAYRTQFPLSAQPARASLAATSAQQEPGRLAQVSARPIPTRQQIVPVAHQTAEPVSQRQENKQSVRDELQRLYAENGREMPRMPAYQPAPAPGPAPAAQQAAPNVTRSDELTYSEGKTGLLAGLFDFGRRPRSNGRTVPLTRPPVEPQPFQPPTYRQEQQRQPAAAQTQAMRPQVMQPQAMHTQAARSPQTAAQQPATRPQQPTTARAAQSRAIVENKRTDADRNFDAADEVFFPNDPGADGGSSTQDTVYAEGLAEFFPQDPAAKTASSAALDTAANSLKGKINEFLKNRPAETTNAREPAATSTADDFKMPVTSQEDAIEPELAPAAVSEVVTTFVAPAAPKAGLAEPAPFFAGEERAINPAEKMEVAALTGQTFDPSGADSRQTAGTVADSPRAGSRMQRIAAREGLGLKGFCPVALRDQRQLSDGKAAFVSFYRGKAYYFSSAEAKATFDSSPSQYAPAADGEDVTMRTLTGEIVDGSLDYSVWYRDRLYLFHSAANLQTFMAAPSAMAVTN